MDALEPGDPQRIGRYRLIRRLGGGGMGRVFLGQSPGGRLVAVKLIRAELAGDPGFRQRFAQEVAAARRVSGIYTAPVVDADPDGPQPWLVTAYIRGPSLADAIAAQGPMPVPSVLALAAGLAEGLGAVHAAGVVHRDLKPSNVLLASDGPRIIDFGISRAADSAWLTFAGGVMGSPGFMSPEQAEGEPVGPPADIFSLGGLLAFAVTGEPPFGTGPPSALLYRVVYGAAAIGHVPAPVQALVARCLAKDPASRPTAAELLDELGGAGGSGDWQGWPGQASSGSARGGQTVTRLDHPAARPAGSGWDGIPWTGQQIPVAAPAAARAALVPRPEAAAGAHPAMAPAGRDSFSPDDPEPAEARPRGTARGGTRRAVPRGRAVKGRAARLRRSRSRRSRSAAIVGIVVAAGLAAGAAAVAIAVEARGGPAAASTLYPAAPYQVRATGPAAPSAGRTVVAIYPGAARAWRAG